MTGWLPRAYHDLAALPAGEAVEGSLQLTRWLLPSARDIVDEISARERADEVVSPEEYDAAAGLALHANTPGHALVLASAGLARAAPGSTVELLLRVKIFAAASLTESAETASHGIWLLDRSARDDEPALAAIVWSAYAVHRALLGDAVGVAECRRVYDALTLDPTLVATINGTQGLLALAETSLGAAPVVVREEWLAGLVAARQPLMVELARAARAIGRPLLAPAEPILLTPRQELVLTLLRAGLTTHAVAHRLGVSSRTVQSDVAVVKAALGVTNRAGLSAPAAASGSGKPLTQRQQQVCDLVRAGYTDRGIALELGISQRTVARHLSDACQRIGVVGRAGLAALPVLQ